MRPQSIVLFLLLLPISLALPVSSLHFSRSTSSSSSSSSALQPIVEANAVSSGYQHLPLDDPNVAQRLHSLALTLVTHLNSASPSSSPCTLLHVISAVSMSLDGTLYYLTLQTGDARCVRTATYPMWLKANGEVVMQEAVTEAKEQQLQMPPGVVICPPAPEKEGDSVEADEIYDEKAEKVSNTPTTTTTIITATATLSAPAPTPAVRPNEAPVGLVPAGTFSSRPLPRRPTGWVGGLQSIDLRRDSAQAARIYQLTQLLLWYLNHPTTNSTATNTSPLDAALTNATGLTNATEAEPPALLCPIELSRIISAKVQVVAGLRYVLTLELSAGGSKFTDSYSIYLKPGANEAMLSAPLTPVQQRELGVALSTPPPPPASLYECPVEFRHPVVIETVLPVDPPAFSALNLRDAQIYHQIARLSNLVVDQLNAQRDHSDGSTPIKLAAILSAQEQKWEGRHYLLSLKLNQDNCIYNGTFPVWVKSRRLSIPAVPTIEANVVEAEVVAVVEAPLSCVFDRVDVTVTASLSAGALDPRFAQQQTQSSISCPPSLPVRMQQVSLTAKVDLATANAADEPPTPVHRRVDPVEESVTKAFPRFTKMRLKKEEKLKLVTEEEWRRRQEGGVERLQQLALTADAAKSIEPATAALVALVASPVSETRASTQVIQPVAAASLASNPAVVGSERHTLRLHEADVASI